MAETALRVAILVISDTASEDRSSDRCIPVLKEVFDSQVLDQEGKAQSRWNLRDTEIVKDDVAAIQTTVRAWTDGAGSTSSPVNLIVTSGGTGFATKDVTPEAIKPLLHKVAEGLVHGMLAASLAVTPFAMMARPVAGVRHGTVIVTLPGSPKGARENLEAIIKLLPHACQQTAGMNSRLLHSKGVKQMEADAGLATTNSQHGHTHEHKHSHGHGHGHGHHGPKAHTNPADRPVSNDPLAGPNRRYRESPYRMLSVEEAVGTILHNTPPAIIASRPVNAQLSEHVLAEDVHAPESVPAFRASIVDGYAIIASEHVMVPSTKGIFPVVAVSHAKAEEMKELKIGEVARITTGAPLPPGATSVVMVEDTVLRKSTEDDSEEAEIEILTDAIKPGENVREVGSDVKAGDLVMARGEGVSTTGGEFGLLASVGVQEVKVYQKPVVGVLSTGDEIVQHDRPGTLKLGEVRDTNRPTLLSSVRKYGFDAVDLGIASDTPEALEIVLRDAMRRVDVLVTSGGASMGELDLLKPTIERQLGGTIHFGRVSMKPGKPTSFATIPFKTNDGQDVNRMIFSLPGNPASAIVTFNLFVLPALHRMSGVEPAGLPRVKVRLQDDVRCDKQRNEYHRCVIAAGADGQLHASSTGGQRSSRIGSFRGANGLLCLPVQSGVLWKGEVCDALLMDDLKGII